MIKQISAMLFALMLVLPAAAAPSVKYAWDLGDNAVWQKNNPRGFVRHTFGKAAQISERGINFVIGKRSGQIILDNLNFADTSELKTVEIFHSGKTLLYTLLAYGKNESGYGNDRKTASSWSGNQRFYPYRSVVKLSRIPRWTKNNIDRFHFLVTESGEGSDGTIRAMAFRRGIDTLKNGSMILTDSTSGKPLHWQWEKTVRMIDRDDFPYPICSVDGGKFSTVLDHLVPEHRYEASIYAAGADSVSVTVFDRDKKIILSKKLQPAGSKAGMTLYKGEYVVPDNAYCGEFSVSGKGEYQVSDALVEDCGGAIYWRAVWIWTPEGHKENQRCYFRKEFQIEDPAKLTEAFLQATCDDAFSLEVNNNRVFNNNNWSDTQMADVRKLLKKGKNVITVSSYNGTSVGGLICELKLTDTKGKTSYLCSDTSWLCRTQAPAEHWRRIEPPAESRKGWVPAMFVAKPPEGSWTNMVRYRTSMPAAGKKSSINKAEFAKRKTVARINHDLDFPRMEVNGEIVTPMFYGVSWRGDRTNAYKFTQKSGFKIFRMRWEFSFEGYRADGSIDYSALDKAVEELLESIPDGKIMLEFRLSPPSWWINKYPNELIKFADGKTLGADGVFASPASEIWRKETADKIREFITHIENSWYSSAIISYMPSNLRGPEWVIPQKHNCFPDYSEPMTRYLRNYLREKYVTNEALQKAWRNPNVTFDTAEVPAQKLRQPRQGYFLGDDRQDVMDYNRAVSRANVDTIMAMFDAIHDAAPNKLRAIYFGYLMTLCHISANPAITGHYDLSRLLASGKVDVMASPITYQWRHPGDISGTGSVESSYRKHGILWLQEADNRTYLTPPAEHVVTHHAATSLLENWREFLYAMIKREAVWFFEIGTGWYDNDYIHDDFKKMLALYKDVVTRNETYRPPAAYFFDEKNFDGVSLNDGRWGAMKPFTMAAAAQRMIALCGVPYDMFELEDIYDLDLDRYKVLYFQNAWRKNPRLAKFLHEKVYPAGKTVVWLYAPGFGQQGGLKGMEELTGMKFEQLPWGTPLYFKSIYGTEAGVPGMNNTEVFAALPPVDEVLGTYPADGKIAAAVKKIGKGTSVWLASYDESGKLMREVCRKAGIELLVDRADRVVCDGEFLGLFLVDKSGKRTVTVPNKQCREAVDIISGEKYPVKNGQFTFDGKVEDIKFFRLK